jgi:hypothetical protein
MTRITLLFLVAALVLPGTALAMPTFHDHGLAVPTDQNLTAPDRDQGTRSALAAANGVDRAAAHRKALAIERYYSSYGAPDSSVVKASAPAPVATDQDGLSWTLAIGAGIGLILVAGGVGLYGGRMVRPRHIGA